MAKYIDAEKLIRDLIDNRSFYPAIVKRAIENTPTEDVVPRSEVERLTIELEAMRGAANSYKMHYEQAQAEKDNLIATYEACMKTYAEQLFEEIYRLLARHTHTCIGYSEIIGSHYYEKQLGNSIDALKKKYIGE